VLLTLGVLGGVGFCVDYSWAVLRRRPRSGQRVRTARDILISATGITILVASFLVDAMVGPARNGWGWLLSWEVGLLAAVMFPVWWHKRRVAQRNGASMETWPFS